METNPAPDDRTCQGFRDDEGACHVRVVEPGDLGGKRSAFPRAGQPLPLRLDLANKSPTGFEWSYAGSGPSQLALALCADALGDGGAALDLFQLFKFRVVAALPHDEPWTLTAAAVRRHCHELQAGGRPPSGNPTGSRGQRRIKARVEPALSRASGPTPQPCGRPKQPGARPPRRDGRRTWPWNKSATQAANAIAAARGKQL